MAVTIQKAMNRYNAGILGRKNPAFLFGELFVIKKIKLFPKRRIIGLHIGE